MGRSKNSTTSWMNCCLTSGYCCWNYSTTVRWFSGVRPRFSVFREPCQLRWIEVGPGLSGPKRSAVRDALEALVSLGLADSAGTLYALSDPGHTRAAA